MDNIFKKLKIHISEFVFISDEEFEKLVSFFTIVSLKKKEYFLKQGELCRHFAFVNDGCLRTFSTDKKGNEYTMYFAFANWWIGDPTSFYSSTPARFSTQALENSDLFRADKDHFEAALNQVPIFEKWYRIKMRKSYEATQQKLIDTHAQTAEEKYLKLLHSAPDIVQKIPQSYIASYLGIKPQSLSRIRKNLSSK